MPSIIITKAQIGHHFKKKVKNIKGWLNGRPPCRKMMSVADIDYFKDDNDDCSVDGSTGTANNEQNKEEISEGNSDFQQQQENCPKITIQIPPNNDVHFLEKDGRPFHPPSNYVSTAKYTIFSFIPKNIFYEQMRRFANVYFVLIVFLQCIPSISNYSPILAAIPVVFILGVTAIKDGIEDWGRHRQDKAVNNTPSSRLYRGDSGESTNSSQEGRVQWQECCWKDLKVGDIVLLGNNEQIPSDILILSTSTTGEGGGGDACTAYVETKNLDGETNLKVRCGPVELDWIRDALDADYLRAKIEFDEPNPNFNSFKGRIEIVKDSYDNGDNDGGDDDNDVNSICGDTNNTTNNTTTTTKTIPVNLENLIIRGSVLRNTDWVIGIILYTGSDTKLELNHQKTPLKVSRIERQMNPQILFNFIILLILSTTCAILAPIMSGYEHSLSLMFVTFFSALILFQTLVPISMYVSVEMVKTIQAYFIYNDLDIYHAESDQRAMPRSWNLADDLGQIKYIFSDKTGTLTQNVMEFRKCSIGGKSYGLWLGDDGLDLDDGVNGNSGGGVNVIEGISGAESNKRSMAKEEEDQRNILQEILPYHYVAPERYSFVDKSLFEDVKKGYDDIADFFLGLVVCHSVLIDRSDNQTPLPSPFLSDNGNEDGTGVGVGGGATDGIKEQEMEFAAGLGSFDGGLNGVDGIDAGNHDQQDEGPTKFTPHTLSFKSQSPDEAALVNGARDLGFVFLGREEGLIWVSILGDTECLQLLHILPFTSERKRMSVIVRRKKTNEIILFCKGADNVIYERLDDSNYDDDDQKLHRTQEHLEKFAEEGLRTLCMSSRILGEEEYLRWLLEYDDACEDMNRRDEMIAMTSSKIEQKLRILGATAIEDKLQEGVPASIEALREAQIKIWVLTGDKVETAINIGFSSSLLKRDNQLLLVVRGDNPSDLSRQLREGLLTWKLLKKTDIRARDKLSPAMEDEGLSPTSGTFVALIIDGATLKVCLENGGPRLRGRFLALSKRCDTVICCRVSPLQKTQVVTLIRDNLGLMTLAIGDGANDVGMIQAADIGVGISSGHEGMQAVMSSDYAIGQFSFITKLLLVHGRWSYLRTREVILCWLYKNFAFVISLFWYQFYCKFTTQYAYDYMYILFYNTVFSFLPLFFLGSFDQDLPSDTLLNTPSLYSSGNGGIDFDNDDYNDDDDDFSEDKDRYNSYPTSPESLNDAIKPRKVCKKRKKKSQAKGNAVESWLLEYGWPPFMLYLLDATWQSLCCFFIPVIVMGGHAITKAGGQVEDKTLLGNVMAISIISCTNIYILLNTYSWTALTIVSVPLTIAFVIVFLAIYNFIPDQTLIGAFKPLIQTPLTWYCILLCIPVSLAPRLLLKWGQMSWKPTNLDVCRSYRPLRMDDVGEMEEVDAASGSGGGGKSHKNSPLMNSRNVSMFNAENNRYEGVRGYAFSHGDKCTIPTSNPTVPYGSSVSEGHHSNNKFKRSASKIFKKIKNSIHSHHGHHHRHNDDSNSNSNNNNSDDQIIAEQKI